MRLYLASTSPARLATLRALSAESVQGRTALEVCELAAEALAHAREDLPHAGIYLADPAGGPLRLTATSGEGAPLPELIDPAEGAMDSCDEIRLPIGAGGAPQALLLVRPTSPWTPHDEHRDFVRPYPDWLSLLSLFRG